MGDPQIEAPGTTHTYVSLAWFKDWSSWFLIAAMAWDVVQDQWFLSNYVPSTYQETVHKAVLLVAFILRIYTAKRPVARRDGVPVEVRSIEPSIKESK